MKEIQKYDCIYNKLSKDYSNRRTTENSWAKIAEKFSLTSADAEKKYKNICTSYVHYLKRLKNIHSGSGKGRCPQSWRICKSGVVRSAHQPQEKHDKLAQSQEQ